MHYTIPDLKVSDWLLEYFKIVDSYSIQEKTLANRKVLINWISNKLGERYLAEIKPYEISNLLKIEYKSSPSKTKRILMEIKNMFKEAIIYGNLLINPALYLKADKVKISRERMDFNDFELISKYARSNSPKWVNILLLLGLITGQRRSDLMKMRYSDVKNGNLHIEQQKTGIKLAIPISLKLDAIDMSIEEVIELSRNYHVGNEFMLRKHNGSKLCEASLSVGFQKAAIGAEINKNISLHECRSLSERLYRTQGIDTRILLGHLHQRTTDMYNDARGLNDNFYTVLKI